MRWLVRQTAIRWVAFLSCDTSIGNLHQWPKLEVPFWIFESFYHRNTIISITAPNRTLHVFCSNLTIYSTSIFNHRVLFVFFYYRIAEYSFIVCMTKLHKGITDKWSKELGLSTPKQLNLLYFSLPFCRCNLTTTIFVDHKVYWIAYLLFDIEQCIRFTLRRCTSNLSLKTHIPLKFEPSDFHSSVRSAFASEGSNFRIFPLGRRAKT